MAPVLVTLNDLEGHSPVAGLFKCNSSNICAIFYQISTDSALAPFLSDSWASCWPSLSHRTFILFHIYFILFHCSCADGLSFVISSFCKYECCGHCLDWLIMRISEYGHYLNLLPTSKRSGYVAELETNYIDTTDMCMELFFWPVASPNSLYKPDISIVTVTESKRKVTRLRTVSTNPIFLLSLLPRVRGGWHGQ